jgi:hypothetical protein
VAAEEELPVLAEPLDSDDELLDVVGVAVLVVAVVVMDVVDVAVVVPAWVCAAMPASAATATAPAMPDEAVSFRRSRSARSRSAMVMRRLSGFMIGSRWCACPHLSMGMLSEAAMRDSWVDPGNLFRSVGQAPEQMRQNRQMTEMWRPSGTYRT